MRRPLIAVLALLAAVAFAWVAIPIVLIRPFSTQTGTGVATAYALRAHAGEVTLGLAAAGLLTAAWLWSRLWTWWGRSLLALAVAVLAGCAWMARQNHFEWMYQPLPGVPAFVPADCAGHVGDSDLVLAVVHGGEARAYPVLALAYHHVVNDVLGDEPIVVTY